MLLTNEFVDGFYNMFQVEAVLRDLAATCPNAYIISLFSCCRQRYNADVMKNGMTKSQAEDAKAKLEEDPQFVFDTRGLANAQPEAE